MPSSSVCSRKYACNKGIGQLSTKDNTAVREGFTRLAPNIRFKVEDLTERGCIGLCRRVSKDHLVIDTHGYPSLISVSKDLYEFALSRGSQDPVEIAKADFFLAIVMLHEVAHALGNANMGEHYVEDFFETSLIGEAGWELEARIFGMCPRIVPKPGFCYWHIWQTHKAMGGYDLGRICRHSWKLPKRSKKYAFRSEFAIKLLSDDFWETEYVEFGAEALIPPWVEWLCLSGKENNETRGIPQSIRDIFRENPKSYAEKKYARLSNPRRLMRGGYPGGQGPDNFQYQDLDQVKPTTGVLIEAYGHEDVDEENDPVQNARAKRRDHIFEYYEHDGAIPESEVEGLVEDQNIGVFKPANDDFHYWSEGEDDEASEYEAEDLPDAPYWTDGTVCKPEVKELTTEAQENDAVESLMSAIEDVDTDEETDEDDDGDAEMTDIEG